MSIITRFKYSEAIDYFVVGTDEHKRSLEAFLKSMIVLFRILQLFHRVPYQKANLKVKIIVGEAV